VLPGRVVEGVSGRDTELCLGLCDVFNGGVLLRRSGALAAAHLNESGRGSISILFRSGRVCNAQPPLLDLIDLLTVDALVDFGEWMQCWISLTS